MMEEQVILAIDIGSSSVRCVAYQKRQEKDDVVVAIDDCSSSIKRKSVEPNTGKIRLSSGTKNNNDGNNQSLFDCIDDVVDSVLKKLRQLYDNNNSSSSSQQHQQFPQIVGIGFSCFVMNLIAIDSNGQVLGDEFTLSYACNTSDVNKECQVLCKELLLSKSKEAENASKDDGDDQGLSILNDLYQKTGVPIHSAYALAQLRCLYQKHPEMCRNKIHRWQTIPGMCISRWTSSASRSNFVIPMSYSEASWTGLFNFEYCCYEDMATQLLPPGCVENLPPVADYTEAIVGLSETSVYWNIWPELRQTPVFLGIGDGVCANIGSKCSTKSRIAVTIGTSAAARIVLPSPIANSKNTNIASGNSNQSIKVPNGLFCYRIDKHNLLLGGALTDGGSVIEWATKLLNLNTKKEDFVKCMKEVEESYAIDCCNNDNTIRSTSASSVLPEATAAKLTMIPFFSGERSTGYRRGATGAVMGMTLATKPSDVLKSSLESVALRLRAIVKLIQETVATTEQQQQQHESSSGNDQSSVNPFILASGGALESNNLWRQMIADSTGLKVIYDFDTTEGTCRGVARLISNALQSNTVPLSKKDNTNTDNDTTGAVVTMTSRNTSPQRQQHYSLIEEEIIDFEELIPSPQGMVYFDQASNVQEEFLKAISPLYTIVNMQPDT